VVSAGEAEDLPVSIVGGWMPSFSAVTRVAARLPPAFNAMQKIAVAGRRSATGRIVQRVEKSAKDRPDATPAQDTGWRPQCR
jgi:hypothetical protein